MRMLARLCQAAALTAALAVAAPATEAQIHTDSTLGHAPQNLVGPNYLIPQSLGLVAGANLFQSFSVFNLAVGEQASFTTTSLGLSNIIARVTGGNASSISGTINVVPAAGAPNFFFVNPSGVTFGNGAQINVPGAFHVTTANYLKFADGRVYGDASHTSTFSALSPEAFGFLGRTRAPIQLSGGDAFYTVFAPLSLVGGDVTVTGAASATGYGPGGNVLVAAVGNQATEVPLSGPLPKLTGNLNVTNGGEIAGYPYFGDGGSIRIGAGNVTVDGQGSSFFTGIYTDTPAGSVGNSGPILVSASGKLSIVNFGAIETTSESAYNAGAISLSVGGAFTMNSSGETTSRSYASGNAGAVSVTAASIAIDGNSAQPSGISSFTSAGSGDAAAVTVSSSGPITLTNFGYIAGNTYSSGQGGDVRVVSAGVINLDSGSSIESDAASTGAAGNVSISAAALTMRGNSTLSQIASSSPNAGDGAPGSISITTSGALTLDANSVIQSRSQSVSSAGSISISAGSITVDGTGATGETSIGTDEVQGGGGSAGTITINTPGQITLLNGGSISANAEVVPGSAGHIVVNAGSLFISGTNSLQGTGISTTSTSTTATQGGNVDINLTGDLVMKNAAYIDADAYYVGNAGSVNVSARNITIDGEGTLETGITSQSFAGLAPGSAGTVNVHASGTLDVEGGGVISTSTASVTGHAGAVTVDAGRVIVDGRNSSIDATAFFNSGGQTGSVSVNAANSITIADGGTVSIASYALSGNPASLKPTVLTLSAPNIFLARGGAINAEAIGNDDAGSIQINFSGVLELDPSFILTAARRGNGGSIVIKGGEAVILDQSGITTSVFGNSGNGGNITIDADLLVLNSGVVQANTIAKNGIGGRVSIDVGSLITSDLSLFVGGSVPYPFLPFVAGDNVIQAAAPTGLSGVIDITSPVLNLSASLPSLGAHLLDSGGLGRSRCQSTGGSSLAQAGRGGFAPSAHDLMHVDATSAADGVHTVMTDPGLGAGAPSTATATRTAAPAAVPLLVLASARSGCPN